MELSVVRDGDRVRFTAKGNIDERGAEDLKQRFRQQNLSDLKEVVFDFGGVEYIGSAGIGKLLLFYKDLSTKNAKIRIEKLSEPIYQLFTTLKLGDLFALSRG